MGQSWLQEAELFHCSRLVQEFNLRQVGINHVSEVKEGNGALDSVYLEVDTPWICWSWRA